MLIIAIHVVLGGAALAVSNGAIDNGKPVAMMIGRGAFSIRDGMRVSAIATLLGALSAVWWGLELLKAFGGHGLAGHEVSAAAAFQPMVAIAAPRWGVPASTTHVMTGAIVGAGASRGAFRLGMLVKIVLAWMTTLPLAAGLAAMFALLLR
jgi:PiT family inorganic phosphate transporter